MAVSGEKGRGGNNGEKSVPMRFHAPRYNRRAFASFHFSRWAEKRATAYRFAFPRSSLRAVVKAPPLSFRPWCIMQHSLFRSRPTALRRRAALQTSPFYNSHQPFMCHIRPPKVTPSPANAYRRLNSPLPSHENWSIWLEQMICRMEYDTTISKGGKKRESQILGRDPFV